MRNFVAKNARTYNKAQTFVDRKKASKLIWNLLNTFSDRCI